MAASSSGGLLLHRRGTDGVEVLLGHMGGPFWARKEAGAWTIPKGEPLPGESLHDAALREFAEELGVPAPEGPETELGEVRQKAGKVVAAWAREADLDVTRLGDDRSTVEIEWPPRSGRRVTFPELDRVRWWPLDEARGVVVAAQAELLDRLAGALGGPGRPGEGPA